MQTNYTKRQHNRARLSLVGAALLWGLAGVCSKSIAWGALSKVAVRGLIALILLLLFKGSFKLEWNRWNVWGAVMCAVTGVLYIAAMEYTTAGTAIVLQYVAPILVFLYGVVFQGKKPKWSEILITLAVTGGILLSFADSFEARHLLGNCLALCSGFTFAAQIIIMNRPEANSGDAMIQSCIFSVLISAPFLFFDSHLVFDAKNIVWVLVLGITQYGFANLLFGRGIQKVDKLEGSLILTIEPIFNPIPVWIFCNERMETKAIIGACIVIAFVTLYSLLPTLEGKFKKHT